MIHIRRANVHPVGEEEEVTEQVFELVELSGYFRKWVNPTEPPESCVSDDDDKISLKSCMSLSTTPVNIKTSLNKNISGNVPSFCLSNFRLHLHNIFVKNIYLLSSQTLTGSCAKSFKNYYPYDLYYLLKLNVLETFTKEFT